MKWKCVNTLKLIGFRYHSLQFLTCFSNTSFRLWQAFSIFLICNDVLSFTDSLSLIVSFPIFVFLFFLIYRSSIWPDSLLCYEDSFKPWVNFFLPFTSSSGSLLCWNVSNVHLVYFYFTRLFSNIKSFPPVPVTITSNILDRVQLQINKCPIWFWSVCLIYFGCNPVHWSMENSSHLLLPMPSLSVLCQLQQIIANYPNPSECLHFFQGYGNYFGLHCCYLFFSDVKLILKLCPSAVHCQFPFLQHFWEVILINITIQSPSTYSCLCWVAFHWKANCFVEV